jgi:hypothetical protein
MVRIHVGFLFAIVIWQQICCMTWAGSIAGIARTDGQPLETGPFASQVTSSGSEIAHEFLSMYLTPQTNTWSKTFRWSIPANTGLAPGQTLRITESVPLIYPLDTHPAVELPISDWHETISSGDLSDYLQWDSQFADTSISAHIDSQVLTIHPSTAFSSDGKSVWFDFDPIQIPTQSAASGAPVTIDIFKQIRWNGPVLDPLPFSHYIEFQVSEYPSTPVLFGDFNGNGIVDAADYVVWRRSVGSTYMASDYEVWRARFGQTAGSGSGAVVNSAVPEPTTILQIILVAAVVSARRRQYVALVAKLGTA